MGRLAERGAGQHIGEMALIDPSQPRSASVIAMGPTVGLVVSEDDFSAVAAHHPDMWRQIAKEAAQRLRQRKKIQASNPVPFLFIACAAESLPVAEAIRDYFENDKGIVAEIWTDSVFKPSKGTMESLESKLKTSDFTMVIFNADDKVESRGQEKVAHVTIRSLS